MPSPETPSKFVEDGQYRFHYTSHGEGPPLVLLHGGGPGASGLSNYRRNIDTLGAHYTLYILDLPGYGRSSKTFDRMNQFYAMGDAVASFMTAVGVDPASLIGNSLGGAAALTLAMGHPDRVDRLILMGPAGGATPFSVFPSPGIMSLFGYYAGDGPSPAKMKAALDHLIYDAASLTPELIQERYEASLDPEILADPPLRPGAKTDIWRGPRLATLPHPTLIIWGMQDKTNTVDQAFLYARTIPQAELYLLPRCGHWAQWEKPAEFHDAVLAFLKRG